MVEDGGGSSEGKNTVFLRRRGKDGGQNMVVEICRFKEVIGKIIV